MPAGRNSGTTTAQHAGDMGHAPAPIPHTPPPSLLTAADLMLLPGCDVQAPLPSPYHRRDYPHTMAMATAQTTATTTHMQQNTTYAHGNTAMTNQQHMAAAPAAAAAPKSHRAGRGFRLSYFGPSLFWLGSIAFLIGSALAVASQNRFFITGNGTGITLSGGRWLGARICFLIGT
jgi:hypothetical protein